jgi:hypothetical protein
MPKPAIIGPLVFTVIEPNVDNEQIFEKLAVGLEWMSLAVD